VCLDPKNTAPRKVSHPQQSIHHSFMDALWEVLSDLHDEGLLWEWLPLALQKNLWNTTISSCFDDLSKSKKKKKTAPLPASNDPLSTPLTSLFEKKPSFSFQYTTIMKKKEDNLYIHALNGPWEGYLRTQVVVDTCKPDCDAFSVLNSPNFHKNSTTRCTEYAMSLSALFTLQYTIYPQNLRFNNSNYQ